MSTLDDLKNSAANTGKPQQPQYYQQPVMQQAFVPNIEMDESASKVNMFANKGSILKSQNSAPRPTVVYPSNVNSVDTGARVKADLSSLPPRKVDPDAVVDNKATIKAKADEILGPNGDFNKYVVKKVTEAKKYIQDQELEEELNEGAPEGEAKTEDELDESQYLEGSNDITTDVQEKYVMRDILSTNDTPETNHESETDDEEFDEAEVAPMVATENPNPDHSTEDADDFEDNFELDRSTVTTSTSDESVDDEDDDTTEEADDIEDDTDSDKKLEDLRSMITEKLKPVSKRLNIKGFSIAKKGTISNNILATKEVSIAKWVLPTTGVTVSMKEISGANLEKMRYSISNNDIRSAMQIIYENIVSPKAPTLEGWLKSIAFEDYDHLFMAIYIAAFADSNYIPIDCTNKLCKKKTYITDNVPIMNMVKFKDDKAKERFSDLYKSEPVEAKGLYKSEIIPISENFAIGFVEPSIYSVMIEMGYLNEAFMAKYNTTASFLPYIDQIYVIDSANAQLTAIDWKRFPNNVAKSTRSRVVRYDKIIGLMNADEIATIRAYINALGKKSEDITYQLPETTCPYCGTVNKAVTDQTASSLVFLRNQLGLLVTT